MSARGEAVAVDLPGRKVLFALLTLPGSSEGAAGFAEDAFSARIPLGDDDYAKRLDALKQQRGVGVLPPHDPRYDLKSYRQLGGDVITQVGPRRTDNLFASYPMLVTFGNLNDPKSVIRVDPAHLDNTFGPGVQLKRITVQITDQPVTTGIDRRLPWLGNYNDKMLDGHRINDSQLFSNRLSEDDFKAGFAH